MIAGGGFYLLFTSEILSLKNYAPRLNKVARICGKLTFPAALIVGLLYIWIGMQGQIIAFKYVMIPYVLLCLTLMVKVFSIKTTYTTYFLAGSISYFILSNLTFFTQSFISIEDFSERFGFQMLLFTFFGIVIEALAFSLLIGYKANETEKEKIRAQENQKLEAQKVVTLLKEQELATIDAMIAGQEKERQQLARDLHDSVGATLAAARLQFEHLQKHKGSLKNEDDIFKKIGQLLEEAYTEVRSMAHIKNSGVIAKFGLLPAIEKLARNISVSKLNIEVQDFGLNKRISNTLEITIFRIIQELVTNIIKHANATQASISLTQHSSTLNIIIEDNGIGFSPKQVTSKKDGMGLSSIERRVEHLEGVIEIDSNPNKGTTILIDIPL
jgi:signal transduction histidine kinase